MRRQAFSQGAAGRPVSVAAEGTGLGLSVAQSLVQAQGGRISAESTPRQGSTFLFTLPLAAGYAGQQDI
ncbi:MAG: ATP-binding protein, partial [Anaerolineae bacterium]